MKVMKSVTSLITTKFLLNNGYSVLGDKSSNIRTVSAVAPVVASPPPPPIMDSSTDMVNKGNNPVGQLFGYVKDSFVRMKDGTVQLYTNHKRCNEIRAKQRDYLAIQAASLPNNEQRAAKKYHISAGGITYEEFDFLTKGKEDRGKLANVMFMMFFAPNFVPYAFMFFPEMLPSPFAMPLHKLGMPHTKWHDISRERSHAVIQTMLELEKAARVAPMLSNLNPFGKGRTRKMMERMDRLGRDIGGLLVAENASGARGAKLVSKVLESEVYSKERPTKDKANLACLPTAVIKGLGRALEAPSFNSLIPTFIVRGKILNTLKQIENADRFLVEQNIDLTSLNTELLQEACSARLIGVLGRSHEEMVEGLASWLETAVKYPEKLSKIPEFVIMEIWLELLCCATIFWMERETEGQHLIFLDYCTRDKCTVAVDSRQPPRFKTKMGAVKN
jgi:LETM1-like protein.